MNCSSLSLRRKSASKLNSSYCSAGGSGGGSSSANAGRRRCRADHAGPSASLPSSNGRLARLNIYETIESSPIGQSQQRMQQQQQRQRALVGTERVALVEREQTTREDELARPLLARSADQFSRAPAGRSSLRSGSRSRSRSGSGSRSRSRASSPLANHHHHYEDDDDDQEEGANDAHLVEWLPLKGGAHKRCSSEDQELQQQQLGRRYQNASSENYNKQQLQGNNLIGQNNLINSSNSKQQTISSSSTNRPDGLQSSATTSQVFLMEPSNQSANFYSEIMSTSTPLPFDEPQGQLALQRQQVQAKQQQQPQQQLSFYQADQAGHYQVPATLAAGATATATAAGAATAYATINTLNGNCSNSYRSAPSINDELNQLIETKRKRTLLLLRAKEAPKASVEQTSSADDDTQMVADNLSCDGACSPALLSDYENLSNNYLDQEEGDGEGEEAAKCLVQKSSRENHHLSRGEENSPALKKEIETRDMPAMEDQQQQQQQTDSNKWLQNKEEVQEPSKEGKDQGGCKEDSKATGFVVSPSESQNFNTLSESSDVLADLSQEESSLVQQLGLLE